MAYTFARVGAALSMNVGDYYPEGKQWSVRLREKGGKHKQIAVHHVLEEYMDAYLAAAGLSEQKGTPLFRTARGKTGVDKAMEQFASDVAEALGAALRASDKEWKPFPFLPLTIGDWRAWHIRFTWLVEDR